LKQRTRRFYNNINTWRIKSIEDYASAITIIRNIPTIMKTRETYYLSTGPISIACFALFSHVCIRLCSR
jgi:hypothetical protein